MDQQTKQQPIGLGQVADDLTAATEHLELHGWEQCPNPNCTLCRPITVTGKRPN